MLPVRFEGDIPGKVGRVERVMFFNPLAKMATEANLSVQEATPIFLPPQQPHHGPARGREREVQQMVQELAAMTAEKAQGAARIAPGQLDIIPSETPPSCPLMAQKRPGTGPGRSYTRWLD